MPAGRLDVAQRGAGGIPPRADIPAPACLPVEPRARRCWPHTRPTPARLPAASDAPIAAGTPVGQLALHLRGRSLGEFPLTALEAVPAGDFSKRSLDRLRQWFLPPARASAMP